MRSTALAGITPAKWVSRFYDAGRRYVGISPKRTDELIAAGARATSNGLVVEIAVNGDVVEQYATSRAHRGAVAKWVVKFNERAGKVR